MILEALQWLLRIGHPAHQSKFFTPEMLANPYPTYARLRATEPVHVVEDDGRLFLTRYADVMTVLRSPAASSQRTRALGRWVPAAFKHLVELRSLTMISNDGATHNRLRLLVSKAFTARAVEAMAPKIQRLVDGYLDAVQSRGQMDLMAELAVPLPVTVIAEMLGVPPQDRERFKHWSDELAVAAGGMGSPAGVDLAQYRNLARAYDELRAYFADVVAQRRKEPRGDLLSALVQAEEAGDRLTEEELYTNAALLLVAGNETTTNLIGNGTHALLRNPDQLARLEADPSLIPTAAEELLRYDSPVQFTTRILTEPLTVSGKELPKDSFVLLGLGAANRDPEQFADPDRLDVGRQDNKHLAFGLGTHFCLGAQLARLEAKIAFETLLRRMPGLRLEGPAPEYRTHFNLRGLKALPVAF